METVIKKLFSSQEYHQLTELGFLNPHIQLIKGELIDMAAKKTKHTVCNTRLWKQIDRIIGELAQIRVQEPIILLNNSEPEPDLVIVHKKDDDYLSSHPTPEDLLLVIEIADTTLTYDQTHKLSLYSEAKIKDYWLFNLIDNWLEIYSNPYTDHQGKSGYRHKQIVLPYETVKLPCFSDLSLNLSLIFPQ
jgi:Uma2 family endonuclease